MQSLSPIFLALALLAVVLVGTSLLGAALDHALARLGLTRSFSSTMGVLRASAPAIFALTIMLAVVVPSFAGHCHCDAHPGHHPHLCLAHPELSNRMAGPAALLVTAWLAATVPALVRLARDLRAAAELGRIARQGERVLVDGVEVTLVNLPGLGACTVGVLCPRVVVDQTTWLALHDSARRAITHHEDAHRRRRDGLTLLALRVLAAVSLTGSTRLGRWRRAAELACDAHAARRVGDALDVADALLQFARVAPRSDSCALALLPSAEGDLEVRVLALTDGQPTKVRIASDLATLAVGAAGSMALVLVLLGSSMHHLVETVLGHWFA